MRRVFLLAVAVVLASHGPALAVDEQEGPAPTIGGPVLTIPVDPAGIAHLVIVEPQLSPQTGLRAGGALRLTARIAAGPPARTVIVIDGVGDLDGDVAVADDGTIDHEITVPADLRPGRYMLSMRAEGLGAAPLGEIEVVPAAASEPEPVATTIPAASEPSSDSEAAVPAALPGATGAESGSGLNPVVIAAIVALALVIGFVWQRRRTGRHAKFEWAAALPTATKVPGRIPSLGEAAEPSPSRAGGPDETGEPVIDGGNDALPHSLPKRSMPAAKIDLVTDPGLELAREPSSHPEEPGPTVSGDAQHADRGANATLGEYVVVELSTRVLDEREVRSERLIARFDDVEAAKAAARRVRSESQQPSADEIWWEVRPAGRSPIWMVHAWGAREYDVDGDTGGATPAVRG